jgi:hypothetical protein
VSAFTVTDLSALEILDSRSRPTLAAVLLGWPREMLVSGSLLCVPRSSQRSGRAVL